MKTVSLLLLPGLCLLAGCVPNQVDGGLPMVGSNQLGTPPPNTVARKNLLSPDAELAGRALFVGRELVALNKNSGLDPNTTFITYPAPNIEIFHPDRSRVFVTEGLVRRCNQEQLTAVLASELGKMAAERILAAPYLDDAQPQPRNEVRPDPRKLAQTFLGKAGYGASSLDAVKALLDEASLNRNIELSVKGLPARSSWEP